MNTPYPVEADDPLLFVDDLLIESGENLVRRLHQPRKDDGGQVPVLELPEKLFDEYPGTLMANGTIVFDPGLGMYVMFVLAFAGVIDASAPDGWKRVKLLRYTSRDGLAWEGGDEGRVEVVYPRSRSDVHYGDSPEDVFHLDLFSCHFDSENRAFPYQGWLFLRSDEEHTGVYHMQSADGHIWHRGRQVVRRFSRRLTQNGVSLMGPGDVSVFSADNRERRFLASLKFQQKRGVGTEHLLRSRAYLFVDRLDDLIDVERILEVDQVPPGVVGDGDEPDDEYYGSTAWRYGSHWLGGLKVFHVNGDHPWSSSGCAFLKLQTGRDGLHWKKVQFENEDGHAGVFIANGGEGGNGGRNDGGYLTEFTSPPLLINNELIFHYGASSMGKNHSNGVRMTGGGVFRARLRLDGFVSVDGGCLTTRQLLIPGRDLFVNHSGPLGVELLDGAGECLAATRIDGDDLGLTNPVNFDGPSVAELLADRTGAGRMVGRIRFSVDEGGSLYAFRFR